MQVTPSRGAGVVVSLSLSAPAEVMLTVRGLGGRVVRQLNLGQQPAGTVTATWDGSDQSGRPLPPGTYLVEVGASAANGAVSRATRTAIIR